MVDVAAAGLIAGPVRDWLAGMRAALNGRFRLAGRRFPALEADTVLGLCRELLPPLAGPDAAGSADLLSAAFDLILLHAGRGTLAPGGGQPGLGVLFREAFPILRPLLMARPGFLPGALSNAVENLGPRGPDFARGLIALAPRVGKPEELLDAGAVLAWRLGDARLRGAALDRADRLPAPATLAALGVPDWPAQAAPLLLAGLRAHGWCRPAELLSPKTLAGLATAEPAALDRLRQDLSAPPGRAPAGWRLAGRPGNFRGFDGHFDRPPLLLDSPDAPGPHRFVVRAGGEVFRIDADAFGWACAPCPPTDAPPARAQRPAGAALPARLTSLAARPGVLACTTADSFRVRVLTPPREPL
jgi:hypothetical protein